MREIAQADHERLIQTNLWGTVNGSLIAVEHLREHGGALINVGSVASDLAFPFQGLYGASKHAVKGFTDTLRTELIAEDAPVSVTLVKPASIDTPLPNRARNDMDRQPTLLPPIYPPAEVANAILHAAVHPQRDIFVGGGRIFVMGKEFAPDAYDELAPTIIRTPEASRGRPEEPCMPRKMRARSAATRRSPSCGRAPIPARPSTPWQRRPSASGSRRPWARW